VDPLPRILPQARAAATAAVFPGRGGGSGAVGGGRVRAWPCA